MPAGNQYTPLHKKFVVAPTTNQRPTRLNWNAPAAAADSGTQAAAIRNEAVAAAGDTVDGASVIVMNSGSSVTKCMHSQARSTGSPRITSAYAITTSMAAGANANSNESRCGS